MKKTLVMTVLIAAMMPLASHAQPGNTSGGATGGASGGAGVSGPGISGGASGNVGASGGLNTAPTINKPAEPGGGVNPGVGGTVNTPSGSVGTQGGASGSTTTR